MASKKTKKILMLIIGLVAAGVGLWFGLSARPIDKSAAWTSSAGGDVTPANLANVVQSGFKVKSGSWTGIVSNFGRTITWRNGEGVKVETWTKA